MNVAEILVTSLILCCTVFVEVQAQGNGRSTGQCVPFTTDVCSDLGYSSALVSPDDPASSNSTSPNLETLQSQITVLADAVDNDVCRDHLKQLLCLTLVSWCEPATAEADESQFTLVTPCQSFCMRVKEQCAEVPRDNPVVIFLDALDCNVLLTTDCANPTPEIADTTDNSTAAPSAAEGTTVATLMETTEPEINLGLCQRISIDLCSESTGYNYTKVPNIRGESTIPSK